MDFHQAQDMVDQWIKSYGVRYFHPMTNMAILMEEVGELARWMSREYGEQSYKTLEDANHAKEGISDEMADILWVLICLANQTGVDLTQALETNLQKKMNRDKDRHLQNPKLQSDTTD